MMPSYDTVGVISSAMESLCAKSCLVGSRVTCDPAPQDTDQDILVWVQGNNLSDFLVEAKRKGYVEDSSYGEMSPLSGNFISLRRDDINLIVTTDRHFYERFINASALAKRFNLLDKEDRVALFSAILYQECDEDLECPMCGRMKRSQ